MIANLTNINKYYDGNLVLSGINLSIEDNDRIGVIGINGCGKTTLIRIITGTETYDSGELAISKNKTIGYLAQNSGLDKDSTIIEEMKGSFKELYEISDRLRQLEAIMAELSNHNSDEYHKISEEYARKSSYFEAKDGYLIDVKIKTVLNGMGFDNFSLDRIINTLSGGEKTRLALAKLLLDNPDLLILDEPTNHLDFKTLMWLEEYLQGYKGAILIVSHDRYFLDKLCTSTCEIQKGKLRRYKGGYTKYLELKEQEDLRQLKEYEKQQKEIAHLQDYVDKNLVRASTAKSAQSRVKQLEKIELIEKPFIQTKEVKIKFEYPLEPHKDVLTVSNIDLAVGEGLNKKTLLDSVSFEVTKGEKVAIIGSNGIGKSSLLKLLLKKIPHTKGYFSWGTNTKVSYFDQEAAHLNPNNTVINELHSRFPSQSEQFIRSTLGRVMLVGENVFKQVKVISGGERAKLCFAIIMLEKANVLVFDEPTNHLDLSTKEVLENALLDYTGTLIFVSHDRYLLNKIPTRILELTEDGIRSFEGKFDDYIAVKNEEEALVRQEEERIKTEQQLKLSKEKEVKVYKTKEQRKIEAQIKAEIRSLENEIDEIQNEISQLESKIIEPDVLSDYQLMNEYCLKIDELKKIQSDKYDRWIELSE